MARQVHSVVINRPVEEVFAFLTDPNNEAQWNSDMIETVQTSESPMSVGSTLRTSAKFLGRRFDTALEVTEYEPNKKYCVKSTSGPIPYAACYIFKPVEGGTLITRPSEAEIGGFFKLAERLVMRQANRQAKINLAALKDLLEGRG